MCVLSSSLAVSDIVISDEQITNSNCDRNDVLGNLSQDSDLSSCPLSSESDSLGNGVISGNLFFIIFSSLVVLYVLVVVSLTITSFSFINIVSVIVELGLFIGVIAVPLVMCLSPDHHNVNRELLLPITPHSVGLPQSVEQQHDDISDDDIDIDALVADIDACLHRMQDRCGWVRDIIAYGDSTVDLESCISEISDCLDRMETRRDRSLLFDDREIMDMINRIDGPAFPSNRLITFMTSEYSHDVR